MRKPSTVWQVALAPAALLIVGCTDRQPPDPVAPTVLPTETAANPPEPGAAADRMLFQVRLGPEGDSRAVGVMLFEIVGGYFRARVRATGLEPLQPIPQHIHLNPTCSPGGGILINLDEKLTVAGEAPGVGAAYPLANRAGRRRLRGKPPAQRTPDRGEHVLRRRSGNGGGPAGLDGP